MQKILKSFKESKIIKNHSFLLNDCYSVEFPCSKLQGIKPYSTRENARPFSIEEQKNILTVGACLTCHKDNSDVMNESLLDFENVVEQVSSSCVLPGWN